MRSKSLRCAALAAGVVSLLACGTAHADIGGTVTFDDLALSSTYNVGSMTTSDGVTITFDTFYWLPGDTPFNGGFAEIHNNLDAGGSGFDMETNNINAHFDFGSAMSQVSVLYGAFGGNLNIQINGTLVNVGDWLAIDGMNIGGVDATVTDFGNGNGRIDLLGNIEAFAIGGQELWIDDVSYKIIPAPGALALLVPAAIFGTRRRRR